MKRNTSLPPYCYFCNIYENNKGNAKRSSKIYSILHELPETQRVQALFVAILFAFGEIQRERLGEEGVGFLVDNRANLGKLSLAGFKSVLDISEIVS